jgi:hypothetical protein
MREETFLGLRMGVTIASLQDRSMFSLHIWLYMERGKTFAASEM